MIGPLNRFSDAELFTHARREAQMIDDVGTRQLRNAYKRFPRRPNFRSAVSLARNGRENGYKIFWVSANVSGRLTYCPLVFAPRPLGPLAEWLIRGKAPRC